MVSLSHRTTGRVFGKEECAKGSRKLERCTDQKDQYAGSDYQHQQAYGSRPSTPTFTEGSKEGHRARAPYPAWTQEANIPLSKEEIEDVLIDLANKFGFQKGVSAPHPTTGGQS